MCWLTWGGGVFPSRGPSLLGALAAPWTMGCSSCLIIQTSWAGQSLESCCMSLAPQPRAWEPCLWAHVVSRWTGLPKLCGHSSCWHSCCTQPLQMQQDCPYQGCILPVRCSFSVSTVMFPKHFQSAGNTTEFWVLQTLVCFNMELYSERQTYLWTGNPDYLSLPLSPLQH